MTGDESWRWVILASVDCKTGRVTSVRTFSEDNPTTIGTNSYFLTLPFKFRSWEEANDYLQTAHEFKWARDMGLVR